MKTILFLCTSTLFHVVSVGTLIFGNASFLFQNKSVQSGLGSIEVEIIVLGQEGESTKNSESRDKGDASKERKLDPLDDSGEFLKLPDKIRKGVLPKPEIQSEIIRKSRSKRLDSEIQKNVVKRFKKDIDSSHKMRIMPLIVPAPKDSGAFQENFFNASGNPSPRYPKMAVLKGLEGETIVRISVDSFGEIKKLEMIQSSGFFTLDEAVLKVLPQWHFERGKARIMDVPFKFVLKSEK